MTTRERVSLQTKPQACQTCHATINPLGFAFENFDAVGRYRTTEQGKPIDASGFYANAVPAGSRSWMNVPFRLPSPALEAQFTAAARAAGLINLEGHRAVGGLRASLYNAMPLAGVEALVAFMKEFERRHG